MFKKNNRKIKVLVAAAEVAPFAKVGGLGDVTGSLPPALTENGCDARVIMPLYGSILPPAHDLVKTVSGLYICSGDKIRSVAVWAGNLPGTKVPVYFIDAPHYFRAKDVYVPGKNAERFLFFSLACLYALPHLKFRPDIIHCHDFHTALIPNILKALRLSYYKNAKTVYTIHNLNYQGQSGIETLAVGGLSLNSLPSLIKDGADGDINFMAQGVLNADAVTTVSPTYAREIMTSTYGASLERVIRKREKDLRGILNGIDTDFFDPARDRFIAKNYNAASLNDKAENKKVLQKKLGLPVSEDTPLLGLVSRLVWQKGLDLITENFARLPAQFVFLGTGGRRYEEQLKNLAKKYPEKFSAQIKFDPELAQLIYAGADIFLMPSRFEPCGLGQMIAMRYGTVPVVRRTGGLADTVNHAVGFSFKEVSSRVLFKTLKQAIMVYRSKPDQWRKMQINGMQRDFSWSASAKEYVKLYKRITERD